MSYAPARHTPRFSERAKEAAKHQKNKTDSQVYDRAWRKLRKSFITENPLCVACLEEDRVTAAEHVDHIIPVTVAPNRRLDRTNLRSLCKTCHGAFTRNFMLTGFNGPAKS